MTEELAGGKLLLDEPAEAVARLTLNRPGTLNAITAELPAEPESAHTSSRKGARNPRIELITRGERRRRWTIEQKQTIAAQSLAPGASPTEVARQYGISSGQLYSKRVGTNTLRRSARVCWT